MKYKIGDKVIILSNAHRVSIPKCSFGLRGVIHDIPEYTWMGEDVYSVKCFCKQCNGTHYWDTVPSIIHSNIKVGEQLLLWGEL